MMFDQNPVARESLTVGMNREKKKWMNGALEWCRALAVARSIGI